MKKPMLVFVAAVALMSTHAIADEVSLSSRAEYPNVLLFNPGDLLNGVVSLEYERAVNTFLGIELGMSVTSFRGAFTPPGHDSLLAVGPEIGVRFHFIKDAPGGLWIGPSVNMAYVSTSNGGEVARNFSYGLGGAVGYNFLLGEHFVFQLGAGVGFNDYGYGLEWGPRLKLGLGGTF